MAHRAVLIDISTRCQLVLHLKFESLANIEKEPRDFCMKTDFQHLLDAMVVLGQVTWQKPSICHSPYRSLLPH